MLKSWVEGMSKGMFWIAGCSLAAIMFLTVTDVILRIFKMPITGTYEIVGFLAAWAIGFAIPQTSLDKGHVAMDFLTGKLSPGVNRVLSVLTRLVGIGLFALLAYNLYLMGNDLRASGDVTPLRHWPLFPLAYGVAAASVAQCLVLALSLFGEGAES